MTPTIDPWSAVFAAALAGDVPGLRRAWLALLREIDGDREQLAAARDLHVQALAVAGSR